MNNTAKLEQFRLVLEVLIQMKDCLDRDDTYTQVLGKSFNITRQLGICWHVYVHTPPVEVTGIGSDYLEPVFVKMGFDRRYPVESQIESESSPAVMHISQRDMYDPDSAYGKLRIKLVDELIKYFEKEIEKTESVLEL